MTASFQPFGQWAEQARENGFLPVPLFGKRPMIKNSRAPSIAADGYALAGEARRPSLRRTRRADALSPVNYSRLDREPRAAWEFLRNPPRSRRG